MGYKLFIVDVSDVGEEEVEVGAGDTERSEGEQ